MEFASFYAQKAIRCRRLAGAVNDDRAAEALSELAEECETLAAQANPYLLHDPRTPDTLAWLEAMLPLDGRLALMHAMTFAFPLIKNDRRWQARIEAIFAELHPSAEEHGNIIIRAARISRRLKAEIAPVDPER
jgi:hypothetical protein